MNLIGVRFDLVNLTTAEAMTVTREGIRPNAPRQGDQLRLPGDLDLMIEVEQVQASGNGYQLCVMSPAFLFAEDCANILGPLIQAGYQFAGDWSVIGQYSAPIAALNAIARESEILRMIYD